MLPGQAQRNHKGPSKREARRSGSRRCDNESRGWSDVRKGPQAREGRELPESEKGQETFYPQNVQKEPDPLTPGL